MICDALRTRATLRLNAIAQSETAAVARLKVPRTFGAHMCTQRAVPGDSATAGHRPHLQSHNQPARGPLFLLDFRPLVPRLRDLEEFPMPAAIGQVARLHELLQRRLQFATVS